MVGKADGREVRKKDSERYWDDRNYLGKTVESKIVSILFERFMETPRG